MEEQNGHNRPSRLDRVEAIIEALANRQQLIEDEFARLLRAQVVTVDEVEKLKRRTEEKFQQLAESQKRVDDSMSVLIQTVDEMIRGRKHE
jgi:hypothetical protein